MPQEALFKAMKFCGIEKGTQELGNPQLSCSVEDGILKQVRPKQRFMNKVTWLNYQMLFSTIPIKYFAVLYIKVINLIR
jgi:hypothetical protein